MCGGDLAVVRTGGGGSTDMPAEGLPKAGNKT